MARGNPTQRANFDFIFVATTLRRLRVLKVKLAALNCAAVTVSGAVCVGIGLYMIGDALTADGSFATHVVSGSSILQPAAYIMLVIGFSAFVSGAFGCFAVTQGGRYQFLISLSGTVEVILLAFACLGIAGSFYNKVQFKVKDLAMKSFREDFGDNNEQRITNIWHPLQRYFRCCGVDGYDDYEEVQKKAAGGTDVVIPKSCCVQQKESSKPLDYDKCKFKRKRYIFSQGCAELIEKALTQNSGLVLISAGLMLVIKIFSGVVVQKMYKESLVAPVSVDEDIDATGVAVIQDLPEDDA